MTARLPLKSFVTEQIPQSYRGPLSNGSTRRSTISSSLILGSHDAVLGR